MIALAAGGVSLSKRYLNQPSGLVVRNSLSAPITRVVVQLSTPDAFGEFTQHQPPKQVERIEAGEKAHIPFDVQGRARLNVSYVYDYRGHTGTTIITSQEGLHLLYDVVNPSRDTFVEGNGVW